MSKKYKNTQPYQLGKKYKKLGKMLMDEKTDIRDLVTLAHELGLDIQIGIGEKSPISDNYALAA